MQRRLTQRFSRSCGSVLPLLGVAALLASPAAAATLSPWTSTVPLRVWVEDPLVKVLRHAVPGTQTVARADAARGETATFQVVARADVPLAGLQAAVLGAPFAGVRARFVGYVAVTERVGYAPDPVGGALTNDFPDILLEHAFVDLPAGFNQPVWVTVPVPPDARPDTYTLTLVLHGCHGRTRYEARLPLRLRVHAAALAPQTLRVTNWFKAGRGCPPVPDLSPADEAYWPRLDGCVRNMVAHRQNTFFLPLFDLVACDERQPGSWTFGFDNLDRWVETCRGAGGRYLEGSHLGRCERRDGSGRVLVYVPSGPASAGRAVRERISIEAPRAQAFLAQFLPALARHVRRRGWLDDYVQHLVDEPCAEHVADYGRVRALVRRHAPRLRTVDAVCTTNLHAAGAGPDIWVPMLNDLEDNLPFYRALQAQGVEVWHYTCMYPRGPYPNRFLYQPLLKTRYVHWVHAVCGTKGYLHWGYNAWLGDPYVSATWGTEVGGVREWVTPGDAYIVYPGADGRPVDSLRFEAMRDGIDDFNLLAQLAARNPRVAARLVGAQVRSLRDYNLDVAAFRRTRARLLDLLGWEGLIGDDAVPEAEGAAQASADRAR